jgi:hypothetical protein
VAALCEVIDIFVYHAAVIQPRGCGDLKAGFGKNFYLPVTTYARSQKVIERLSQRGDGSGDDDADDDGDTAVRKQKP